jgi:hypothetical protein
LDYLIDKKETLKLSKRRRNFWDEEAIDFKGAALSHQDFTETFEMEDTLEESEFLEEAHEALSKLFNKTNKRARQMKGVRRKDAWQ